MKKGTLGLAACAFQSLRVVACASAVFGRSGVRAGVAAKSPDQSKSRAEELAIKGKAAAAGKTGAKRFY